MNTKIAILLVLIAGVAAFFYLDLGEYLTLEYLGALREEIGIGRIVEENPIASRLVYFLIYISITGLSLPGAGVLTLAGGAIFGLWWGLFIVSFASSIGATLAFLASRKLLGEWVQGRFAEELAKVNEGFARDGNFYLYSVRMVPLVPFFAINLVMGLTRIPASSFYLVSQVGMLPGTFVYIFAGTQLARVQSVGDVLSPGFILAVSLLGLLPLIAKKAIDFIKRRRADAPRS